MSTTQVNVSAARAMNAMKIYGEAGAAVGALAGVTVEPPQSRVHGV